MHPYARARTGALARPSLSPRPWPCAPFQTLTYVFLSHHASLDVQENRDLFVGNVIAEIEGNSADSPSPPSPLTYPAAPHAFRIWLRLENGAPKPAKPPTPTQPEPNPNPIGAMINLLTCYV